MSLFKHIFLTSKIAVAALFLMLGAVVSFGQDIEPGSSVMEAKTKKPPTKTKSPAKTGSPANSKPAAKAGKIGSPARPKTNPSPITRNAKSQPKEGSEETNELLNLEIVLSAAPVYPGAAKQAGAAGRVRVDVVVDENGNVISAKAKDGHEMLREPAEKAALATKFMPRKVKGKAVQTSGFLVYCFGGDCN